MKHEAELTRHYLKGLTCPACDAPADGAAGEGRAPPEAGDFSVCVYCSAVLRFTAAGGLRVAEALEIRNDTTPALREQITRFVQAAAIGRIAGVLPSRPRR
jgi:hypothetical protein